MIAPLFDIKGKVVVLNLNTMLIPEFKAIIEAYPDDYIQALSYIHFLTDPNSPYERMEEDKKEAQLKRDYPGKYGTQDEVILAAIEKRKAIFEETPEDRLYASAKFAAEICSEQLRKLATSVTDLKELESLLKNIAMVEKTNESLSKSREAKENARYNKNIKGNTKPGIY